MTGSTCSIPRTDSSREISTVLETDLGFQKAQEHIQFRFPTYSELDQMSLSELVDCIRSIAASNSEIQECLTIFESKGILNSKYESRVFIQNMRSLYSESIQPTEINDASRRH